MLTPDKQEQVCRVVTIGCDRETACLYVDCTLSELRQQIEDDEPFAKRLARAEANAEVNYMTTIHNAAKEDKNWRASVWWFERRAPERFARKAYAVTPRELAEVFDQLARIVGKEIASEEDRARLFSRLGEIERKAETAWDVSHYWNCEEDLSAGEAS